MLLAHVHLAKVGGALMAAGERRKPRAHWQERLALPAAWVGVRTVTEYTCPAQKACEAPSADSS